MQSLHKKQKRFLSYYGQIPEWPKGADCKSVGTAFEGSNPSPPTKPNWLSRCGSIGRAADL